MSMAHDVYSTPYVFSMIQMHWIRIKEPNGPINQIKSGRPFHRLAMFETLCHAIIP